MTSTPAHPPPTNAANTHQNETIGSAPFLPSWFSEKIAPRLRYPIPSYSGSESTFSLLAISRIVAELQSSSGVDFPGMQGEPADRETRLHPDRFVVRRVAYIAVSIFFPLRSSGYETLS
jgi:hypothetical protein